MTTESDPLGASLKFQHKWNVWYHHSLNDWSVNGYKKIFTIETIKDFWDFHNNINCIGGINNLHFFLMKDNVTPIWEDPVNRNGGSWSLLVPLDDAYKIWELLAVKIVGENLTNQLTGISINQKNNVSIIKIWNMDKNQKDVTWLPDSIKKLGTPIYRPHKVTY